MIGEIAFAQMSSAARQLWESSAIKIAEAKKIASTWKDAIFYETNGLGHSMHDNQLYHKVSDFLFEKES